MRELLTYLMEQDEEDVFKPASAEELETRPGWKEEQAKKAAEERAQQAKIAGNRIQVERLGRLATAVGFVPQPMRDQDLRYQANLKAKRDDGAMLDLRLARSWKRGYGAGNTRLHVRVDYETTVRGQSRVLPWNLRPAKVVLDYNRTDDQLVTAIKKRVKEGEKAIAASHIEFEQEYKDEMQKSQFLTAAEEILGVKRNYDRITAGPIKVETVKYGGEEMKGFVTAIVPLDMFKEVLVAIRDKVR